MILSYIFSSPVLWGKNLFLEMKDNSPKALINHRRDWSYKTRIPIISPSDIKLGEKKLAKLFFFSSFLLSLFPLFWFSLPRLLSTALK